VPRKAAIHYINPITDPPPYPVAPKGLSKRQASIWDEMCGVVRSGFSTWPATLCSSHMCSMPTWRTRHGAQRQDEGHGARHFQPWRRGS